MRSQLNMDVHLNSKGKSFISKMNYSFPLKIMRPFYLDRMGTAFLYVMDCAGGMLSRDRIDYDINVDAGAHLYLTNASASKIYCMTVGSAEVHNHFQVGADASLEYFPEEVMLFKDSSLESVTHIHLHPSSVLAFSEVYSAGRKSYGELFQFREMINHFKITIGQQLAIWEKYKLDPEKIRYSNLGYMDNYTHWGSLYLYANIDQKAILQEVRECLPQDRNRMLWSGCSLQPSGVIVVKVLAAQYEVIKQLFHAVWTRLRPLLLKEGLPHIRK